MNQIGRWRDPKDSIPIPGRLVLLKTGEYEYIFARFDSLQEPEGSREDFIVGFLGESDESCTLDNVIAWAYAELDEENFGEDGIK